jgi:DNA polymerase V
VVLSNNDGCVVARSNEAKALGIPMGAPFFQWRRVCEANNVHVFSSNYALYGDMSHRVMTLLSDFTPDVELYSIDEAFMDLSSIKPELRDQYCRDLRRLVKRATGIPVSIGIAETKTLSKIAGNLAKKSPKANGVLDLTGSKWQDEALRRTPVGDVWGVGRQLSEKLKGRYILTALDLRDADEKRIQKMASVVLVRTMMELRGIPCLELEHEPPYKKSLISSRSFGRLVEDKAEMEEAVATYTARAAEKLRQDGQVAECLTVEIRTNKHRQDLPQYRNAGMVTLPGPTDCTHAMITAARKALDSIWLDGFQYYKALILLTGLSPKGQQVLSIFDRPVDQARDERLMKALDRINGEYGEGTLHYAAQGVRREWAMKRQLRSPCYTTRVDQIPVVMAN